MKLIKGKLARVFFGALTIFLAACMLFTGCGRKPKEQFEKGFNNREGPILVGVTAETDTFDIEAVSFDLYYGMYDYADTRPKASYMLSTNSYIVNDAIDDIVFGVYVCGANDYRNALWDDLIDDYTKIDGHFLEKTVADEEAFSDEYGYTREYRKRLSYNHIEQISIPNEIFVDEEGTFAIKIMGFQMPLTEAGKYHVCNIGDVILEYQKVDETTVKIIFSPYSKI